MMSLTAVSEAKKFLCAYMRRKAAREAGLKLRVYQVDAAAQAFSALVDGNNAAINLPTGSGKTIVANMVSLLAHKTFPSSRMFYIVPRRILIDQHERFGRWMRNDVRVAMIDDHTARNSQHLQSICLQSDVLISTPKLAARLIRQGLIPNSVIRSVSHTVVDEFDAFLVFEYREDGPIARFSDDYAAWVATRVGSIPCLLLSATSPLEATKSSAKSIELRTLAEFVLKNQAPEPIIVPDVRLKKHLPTARVHRIIIKDNDVALLAEGVRAELASMIDRVEYKVGSEIDRDYLKTRLDKIVNGTITHIRTISGNMLSINREVKRLCASVRRIMTHYDFLGEDLFGSFHVEQGIIQKLDRENWRLHGIESVRLIDDRKAIGTVKHYEVALRSKASWLLDLLSKRSNEKGVLFTRTIRLAKALCTILRDSNILHAFIHGNLTSPERRQQLQRFDDKDISLLVITRDTGKRGLDLPMANFGVFYSPKSRETTVWQELSRIRSDVSKTKDSYFLLYDDTPEITKCERLFQDMENSGRNYTLVGFRSGASIN